MRLGMLRRIFSCKREANAPAQPVKQWGGYNKKKSGRELLGRTWNDRPPVSHLSGSSGRPESQYEIHP